MMLMADPMSRLVWSCGSANGTIFLQSLPNFSQKFLKFCIGKLVFLLNMETFLPVNFIKDYKKMTVFGHLRKRLALAVIYCFIYHWLEVGWCWQ